MMDPSFRAWVERLEREAEAQAMGEDVDTFYPYAVPKHQEWTAPPVSPEVETFCADLQRQWRKR